MNYLHYCQNLHDMPKWIVNTYVGKLSNHDKRINSSMNNAIDNLAKEVLIYTMRWDDFYTKYPDVSHIAFLLTRSAEYEVMSKRSIKEILSEMYSVGDVSE